LVCDLHATTQREWKVVRVEAMLRPDDHSHSVVVVHRGIPDAGNQGSSLRGTGCSGNSRVLCALSSVAVLYVQAGDRGSPIVAVF